MIIIFVCLYIYVKALIIARTGLRFVVPAVNEKMARVKHFIAEEEKGTLD